MRVLELAVIFVLGVIATLVHSLVLTVKGN